EEACERLAVLAVAEEAKAGGDFARDAAHVAAPAPKREVRRQACRVDANHHASAPIAGLLLTMKTAIRAKTGKYRSGAEPRKTSPGNGACGTIRGTASYPCLR